MSNYPDDQVQRSTRDNLLTQSDWTQLPDVTIDNKTEWATYRQQLRDITNDPDWPNVEFPPRPDADTLPAVDMTPAQP